MSRRKRTIGTVTRRLWSLFAALAIIGVVALPLPAQAAVDTAALIMNPPTPGFQPVIGPDETTGRVDHEGNVVGDDYTPPANSGYVNGHAMTFARPQDNGDRFLILVGEFKSPSWAKLEV